MESQKFNVILAKKMAIGLFIILSIWWIFIAFVLDNQSISSNLTWGASYQLMALYGAICGFVISRAWGGFKSIIGKTIIFFSLGLLLQVFGQSVFSFYNLVLQVDIPYPSLADIGYFLSIPFYIYATILLGQASGMRVSLKSYSSKIQAILIPAGILIASYMIFLKGYDFQDVSALQIFLDFGYPLGQAFYVSIALLVFILSKNFLGGLMKPKVFTILVALIIQYFADYNFLFQAYNETWVNGGYGDYIYLFAYFVMAVSLIDLGGVFNKIKNT